MDSTLGGPRPQPQCCEVPDPTLTLQQSIAGSLPGLSMVLAQSRRLMNLVHPNSFLSTWIKRGNALD